MGKLKINRGMRFGKLTIVEELDRYILPCGQKVRRFKLICDCGNYTNVNLSHLVHGKITSCGCLAKIRDGESTTKIFKAWKSMIDRCGENYFQKHLYYDRGIAVSDEFKYYFDFKKWAMGNGYKPGLQLDRINNNMGYSPDNCRFVTAFINANNKRTTFKIKYNNRNRSFMMVLREKGLHFHQAAIRSRIARGWSAQKAIDTPIRKGNYKKNIMY